MLAHEKVRLREQEKRNFFSWVSEFLIVLRTKKSHARKNRMAEIVSPASDPRSLRRHYPHQVQGVVQSDLSAVAAPPHFYLVQNRTRASEVNDERNRRPSVMAALQIWNVVVTRRLKGSETPYAVGCYWPADLTS